MPKYIRNAGKYWTPKDEKKLAQMAKENVPTRIIGLKLGRPIAGVYSKAGELGVGLRPTNQSPYNRRNK